MCELFLLHTWHTGQRSAAPRSHLKFPLPHLVLRVGAEYTYMLFVLGVADSLLFRFISCFQFTLMPILASSLDMSPGAIGSVFAMCSAVNVIGSPLAAQVRPQFVHPFGMMLPKGPDEVAGVAVVVSISAVEVVRRASAGEQVGKV